MMQLFIGIDPGQTGGMGVLDQAGHLVTAVRWDQKDPAQIYHRLELMREQVSRVYLEEVNLPQTGAGLNFQHTPQALLVNQGIWLGWLIALSLPVALIPPQTWQAATGLHRWKSNLIKNPTGPTPLNLARRSWPTAPLEFQADDGRAVGLLLADLARRDHWLGIDRRELQKAAHDKKITKRRAEKQAQKIAALGYDLNSLPGEISPVKAKRTGNGAGHRSSYPKKSHPRALEEAVFPKNFPKL